MPRLEERVGLPVVAAQGDVIGAVGQDHRDQITQVLAGRPLADEDPHPLAPLLLGLFELGALVIGLHPGGQIRVQQARPESPGAWPSTRRRPAVAMRASISGSPAMTPGKFMTSATPMAAYSSSSVATSGANNSAPGLSKGEAGTQLLAHTPNVNGRWSAAAMSAATPGMPRTLAISWGSAATAVVPKREHGAHELVDPQLRRFEVHVGVHQAGRHRRAVEVDLLDGVPGAPARHDAIGDGQVGRHPLPARRREHPPAPEEQIGRRVTAGNRQDVGRRRGACHEAWWLRHACGVKPGTPGCFAPQA